MSMSDCATGHLENFQRNRLLVTPVYVLIATVAISFLPFTRALTLNIGFPLKIYEILFTLAIPLFLLRHHSFLKWFVKKYLLFVVVLLLVATYSSLLMMLDTPSVSDVSYRCGRTADALMRITYFGFNLVVFFLTFHSGIKYRGILVNAWFVGLVLAISYHAYTFLSFAVTGEAILLPGLERHQTGWLGTMLVPRSGTFEEGNFAGLYYLASLALAIHVRKRFYAVIALCGIFLTLSTSTILSLLIFFCVFIFCKYKFSFKQLAMLIIIVLIGIFAFFGLEADSKFKEDPGASGAVRLNEALTGLQIFRSKPLLGAGLGQYGFLFKQFEWKPESSTFSVAEKRISNNVYVELLAETGFTGLLMFLLFGWHWTCTFLKSNPKSCAFFAFGVSAAVAFIAYPTFNITYLWCFAGIALSMSTLRPTVSR